MGRPVFILLFLCGSLALEANASRVLKIADEGNVVVISQEKERPWTEQDRVCFYRGKSEIACGDVIVVNETRAVVKLADRKDEIRQKEHDSDSDSYVELDFAKAQVSKNDRVELTGESEAYEAATYDQTTRDLIAGLRRLADPEGSSSGSREPASLRHGGDVTGKDDLLSVVSEMSDGERLVGRDRFSNVSLGLSYIFPELQYQQALNAHVATGIMPMYLNTPTGTSSIKGVGTYVTVNYYGLEPFHGTWAQFGLGAFSMSATTPTTSTSYFTPALTGSIGWRWLWPSGLNFGFAVGGQYLPLKSSAADLDFSGLLPSVTLDLGFAF